MKKIFFLILILATLRGLGQTPPGWTKINFSYEYVGFGADSNTFIPRYSTAPTIRNGKTGAGQVGIDTVGHAMYFYSGGVWRVLGTGQWTTTGSDIYYNIGGVGVGATSVNSRAILELTSTAKGFLMPRMNTTQQTAISSPPSGLVIYNTDSLAFVYYNGTAWLKIGTGSGGAADGRGNDSLTFREEGLALGTKGSVKTVNIVGQSVKATRWSDSVTVFGASNNTGYDRNNTLINQKYYDAFPSVAWDPITLHTASVVWKSSGSHAAEGPALISYSHDGFSSFTPSDTIKTGGTNITNANTISIGRGNGNRWVIQWNTSPVTTNVICFAYNDEEDETFSAKDSLTLANYQYAAAYGQILQIHGDTLYAPAYGVDTITGHTQSSVFYIKSYNNGVSWSYGGLIYYGGTFNANAQPGELDWVIISGTQVSNTKLLALCRDNYNGYRGYHNELTSSDGGTTWTNHLISEGDWAFGAVNAGFTVDNSWPAMLIKRDTMVYALHGVRNTQGGGGFSFRIFEGNSLSVFNSVLNWDRNHFKTAYRAAAYYQTGGDKDFGYYHPYITPTGEIKALFYDAMAQAAFGFPFENIKSMPVLDNTYYEAFNDANQSITSGTETAVTFPDPFLDGQLYYNSDSSKIYAASDGYYTISVQFLIDTSSLGTYRQAKIKIIFPGMEFTAASGAERIVSKVTYQPSNDFNFCWIELHAQAYIRKGEEIRVTFKHDKGSSLNLLNTISDTNIDGGGARIKIKKID